MICWRDISKRNMRYRKSTSGKNTLRGRRQSIFSTSDEFPHLIFRPMHRPDCMAFAIIQRMQNETQMPRHCIFSTQFSPWLRRNTH